MSRFRSAFNGYIDNLNAMDGDKERCLEAGMDGYVSKPVHSRDLFDVIENVLLPSRVS